MRNFTHPIEKRILRDTRNTAKGTVIAQDGDKWKIRFEHGEESIAGSNLKIVREDADTVVSGKDANDNEHFGLDEDTAASPASSSSS